MSEQVQPQSLLDDLARVRWDLALRTYGNSHATLIGLLVAWWLDGGAERWALESGPAFGYRERAVGGGGQCDAILGAGEGSLGVIEVEGSRHAYTIAKIGNYFAAEHPDLATLEFGILLAYAYGPSGRGKARTIPPLPVEEYLAAAREVTARYPGKQLLVLTLDKAWEPQQTGPRARSEYYGGRPSTVWGWLVAAGAVVAAREFAPESRPLPIPSERAALTSFTGCLLGGAVGDALGAPVEFLALGEIRARFGPAGITDYAPAYGRLGAITDDTQMTLFTAEGLLRADTRGRRKGICHPPSMVAHAYRRWLTTQGEPGEFPYPEAGEGFLLDLPELHHRRAPGNTCLAAVRAGASGTIGEPINDSKGCGGVMRVAPVGLAARGDVGGAFMLGCEVAALTHGHPSGYLSAGFLAALIAALVDGSALDDAIARTRALLLGHPRHDETLNAIDAAVRLARGGVPTPEALATLGQGWIAEEALAIALCCALVAPDFRGGVALAVNHGGDSDSTGAIAGNILGAIWGRAAIPTAWLDDLELRATIEVVATDLHDRFGLPRPSDTDHARELAIESKYPGW